MDPEIDIADDVKRLLEGDPDGAFNLANDLCHGHVDEVIEELYKCAIAQGVNDAFLNLGNFYDSRGNESRARQMWEKAYESGDLPGALLLAWHLEADGRYDEALTWYSRASSRKESVVTHASLLKRMDREQEALDLLRENCSENAEAAVELVTEYPDLFEDKGLSLLQMHYDSGSFDVIIPLANILSEVGQDARAMELLRQSHALGEPHAAFNLGILLCEAGCGVEGREIILQASMAGDDLAAQWIDNETMR